MSSVLDRPLLAANRRITRSEYPYGPSDPRSLSAGLHEARLRSPVRVLVDVDTGDSLPGGPDQERFYQSVHHMAIGPALTPARSRLYRFEFHVRQEEYDRLTPREIPQGELLPVERQSNGSLRYRIRCCKGQSRNRQVTEAEWAILDTCWPLNIFINLNGSVVSVRRKAHNGRDLAADVTSIVCVGTNILQVAIPEPGSLSAETPPHVMGVEVIKTERHGEVVGQILGRGFRQASTTVDEIRRRLATAPGDGDDDDDGDNDDDDDFAVVQADLSVDLADPFSAKVFETPVRGSSCLHMECFDLANWLNTRPSNSGSKCQHRFSCKCNKMLEPTLPDKWRCPICSQDARPKSLRVDGFLVGVREQLEKDGALDRARSIRVAPDGTWRPILQETDDDEGLSDEDGNGANEPAQKVARTSSTSTPGSQRRAAQAVEIIELD